MVVYDVEILFVDICEFFFFEYRSYRRLYVYNLYVVIYGVGYWSVGIYGYSVCIWSGCRIIYGGKVFYFVRCLVLVVF